MRLGHGSIFVTMVTLLWGCGPSVDDVGGDAGGESGAGEDEPDEDDGPGQEDAADGDDEADGETGGDDDDDDAAEGTTGSPELCPLPDGLHPTYESLQQQLIETTCTPFLNVCHNNKEYPDLRAPHGLLDVVGVPCNLGGDPASVNDQCERVPDRLRITSDAGDFTSDVARFEYDEVADVMTVELRDGPGFDPGDLATLEVAAPGEEWMLVPTPIVADEDDPFVQLLFFSTMATEPRSRMEALAAGDPNGNGSWGAERWGYLEITPGDVTSSYLFLALTGDAPTAPMPLANQPLTDEDFVSLACWIEGLVDPGGDSPDAEIDYEGCEYAQAQYCD